MKPSLIGRVRIDRVGRRNFDKRKALPKLVFWLTFEMLYKCQLLRRLMASNFLGRMRKSPMAIGSNQRRKCQILVAGAACVDCDRRTLVKSIKKCRIIVHQRLPVRR